MKQLGTVLKMVKDPGILWMLHNQGYDLVMLDHEHGAWTDEQLEHLCLQGRALGLKMLVRIPEASRTQIQRALDGGASGIILPMVNTPEMAQSLVSQCLYPPLGIRGYSGGANTLFAGSGNHRAHADAINRNTLIYAQIETREAVNQVDAIAAVNGLTGLLVGPADLSLSYGAEHSDDPQLVAAIDLIGQACRDHNIRFGMIAGLGRCRTIGDVLDDWIIGVDQNLLHDALLAQVEAVHNVWKEG